MQTVDGRPFATREDLTEISGYSRRSLATLWRERDDNSHPAARTLDGVMHWDLEQWSQWFAKRQQPRAPKEIDRSGEPDEELPPAEQARLLGVDLSRITQYGKNPPPGWPDPIRTDVLPTRTREYRTRAQLWEFADRSIRLGTPGGRPPGPAPRSTANKKVADPRVKAAVAALAAGPGRKPGVVAAELAEHHGGSVHTWKRIITDARKQAR